jgi:hypothetical protein
MVLLSAAACGGSDDAAPVATPSVTMARTEVAIGSPVDVRYRFAVARDAPPFREDYWVFVHLLDQDGELMWTDDHPPATPTRQWKPGAVVEYARTMFVPDVPYVGTTVLELGLFSPESGERLPLDADTNGQRAYALASFDLTVRDETRVVTLRDGWHPTEMADDDVGTQWQWSTGDSTLEFRNPRADATFFLQLDQPVSAPGGPQQVEVHAGQEVVDRFPLPSGQREVRRIPLRRSQLGDADVSQLRLTVDRAFVPAQVPALKSGDGRRLGVRVFRAYVEPR